MDVPNAERKKNKGGEERKNIRGKVYLSCKGRSVNEVTRVAQSVSRYIDVKLREK